MAAPTYTTDLLPIDLAESNVGYTNIGTGADTYEQDYFIQGLGCVSKPFNITAGGIYYDKGSDIAIPSPKAFWMWYYFACPNALLSEAALGMRALVGSSAGNYKLWKVRGKDTYTYGGWICVPVDPNLADDGIVGSPVAGAFRIFGWYALTSAGIFKGNPFGMDALRHGRGEFRIAGGDGEGYATFAGAATQNDITTNRWGLIQAIDGGYLQQGMVILGYEGVVDFRDKNTSVLIANTKKVKPEFNRFEVRQAGSKVEWKAISITALGSVSRGDFEAVDDADISHAR